VEEARGASRPCSWEGEEVEVVLDAVGGALGVVGGEDEGAEAVAKGEVLGEVLDDHLHAAQGADRVGDGVLDGGEVAQEDAAALVGVDGGDGLVVEPGGDL
jgi:hypothetical protein